MYGPESSSLPSMMMIMMMMMMMMKMITLIRSRGQVCAFNDPGRQHHYLRHPQKQGM
jgi:hypothetical protein